MSLYTTLFQRIYHASHFEWYQEHRKPGFIASLIPASLVLTHRKAQIFQNVSKQTNGFSRINKKAFCISWRQTITNSTTDQLTNSFAARCGFNCFPNHLRQNKILHNKQFNPMFPFHLLSILHFDWLIKCSEACAMSHFQKMVIWNPSYCMIKWQMTHLLWGVFYLIQVKYFKSTLFADDYLSFIQ